MLSILTTILVFGLVISLLVFVHEGGHFLVAKWAGVWVHEFAIGFGPAAFRKKKGETEYTFRILPLGGFVRMAGEESDTEEDQEVPPDRLFSAKSPWARMAIIFAGPIFNIVFAILMIIAYVGLFGTPFIEVVEVNPNAPSAAVFQSGDKLVKLNGEEIYFAEQIQTITQAAQEQEISAVVRRGDQDIETTVQPYYDSESGRYLIGIYFRYPLNQIRSLPSDSDLVSQELLLTGDYVYAINGTPTINWHELTRELTSAIEAGGEITIKRQREGVLETVTFDAAITSVEEIEAMEGFDNDPLPPTTNALSRVEPDSFFYNHGLRTGDVIQAVNGRAATSSISLLEGIFTSIGTDEPLDISYTRDGSSNSIQIDLAESNGLSSILDGTISFAIAQRSPENVFVSARIGVKRIGDIMVSLWLGIRGIFTGEIAAEDAFRGPVGIANILGWSLTQGFDRFFQLVALLSLVLGVFNLVPFPALDGSRIVFIFYELVRGKPIPPEKEGWVHYIGFILLMGLIVLITWQDIQRIITGGGL